MACLPDTAILMSDGSTKKIRDIRLFDSVVTAEGNTGCVTQLLGSESAYEMGEIAFWGMSHFSALSGHPILTSKGYVPTRNLSPDTTVANVTIGISGIKREWCRVQSVTTMKYSGRVYNLKVAGDNSYVADGIGVHN